MKPCIYCGQPAPLCRIDNQDQGAHAECIPFIRQTPGFRYSNFAPCPEKPGEKVDREYLQEQAATKIQMRWFVVDHAWVQAKQQKEEEEMKASTAASAQKEGRDFARMLAALIGGSKDFEVASDFAQYFAVNVLGYTSADLANPWTKGFLGAWLNPDAPDPSQRPAMTEEQFQTWLRAYIVRSVGATLPAPPPTTEEND